MDIETELENIEEIRERDRFTDNHAGQVSGVLRNNDNMGALIEQKVPSPMEQHGETGMPPHLIMPLPHQGGRGPSGPPRPAPSMPNMRHRIQVGHECCMSRDEID